MINFYNQVPSVYPTASRDFQYISWLVNIVLNYVKHNIDDLYELPHANIDQKLAELLALTLGFKVKRNYEQKQLAALVAILPSILKYKGTEKAVTMAAEALITASGASGTVNCKVDGARLIVTLPSLLDTTLFLDLLDYILPAGMTCRIVRKDQTNETLKTKVKYSDEFIKAICEDLDTDYTTNLATGLAMLFDVDNITKDSFTTANFAEVTDDDNKLVLNTGLLTNTVIPVIPNATQYKDISTGVGLFSLDVDGKNYALYCSEQDGSTACGFLTDIDKTNKFKNNPETAEAAILDI